jgi:hypothetical protein
MEYIEGRSWMTLVASLGNEPMEPVSVAWLEDALEYAHAHGQMSSLTYLEAVMEDVEFVMEMAAKRKASSVG